MALLVSSSCRRGDIIAEVDGDVIFESEFISELLRRAGKDVLEEMITEKLIRKEAKAKGITVTPSEVDAELKRRYGELHARADEIERMRRSVETNLLLKKLCMSDEQAMPTTSEIIAYYKQHKEEFATPGMVRLRCIVVGDEASAVNAYRALVNYKGDFTKLASQISIDESTRIRGGDMGKLPLKDLHPKLRKVVEEMNVGDISKPFELDGRWWIVKVEEHTEKRYRSLEDVKQMITQILHEQKAFALQPVYTRKLWGKANIKIYRRELRGIKPK
ncbi:MAG: hypothetical protein RUDDFDWM_001561 [Candidatus Fervidibacterota bacterium]